MATRKKKESTKSRASTRQREEALQGEVIEAKPDGGAPGVTEAPPDAASVRAGSTALAVRHPDQVTEWTPRLLVSLEEAVAQDQMKEAFMKKVMKEGIHYGKIPGMPKGAKPICYKPGAEKLNSSMGLHPVTIDAPGYPVYDLSGKDHINEDGQPEPFIAHRHICEIRRQVGPGRDDYVVIAALMGSANSWEVKYRYRDEWTNGVCPECGTKAIRQSKGGAFYCWAKQGGCGTNFRANDPRMKDRKPTVKRIKNPEPMDLDNSLDKMSQKRAMVNSTLSATGFSSHLTQDLEDKVTHDESGYSDYEGIPGGEEGPPPSDEQEGTSKSARSTKTASGATGSSGKAAAPSPSEKAGTPTDSSPTTSTPAATTRTVDPVQKMYMDVAQSLSQSLTAPWSKEKYKEERDKLGRDYAKLVGLLVMQHDVDHGSMCEHVMAIPEPVEYRYPTGEEVPLGAAAVPA